MIPIYKTLRIISCLWLLICATAFGSSSEFAASGNYYVTGIQIDGLKRTDEEWFRGYVNVVVPAILTDDDKAFIERKLLTTSAFTSVVVTFAAISNGPEYRLNIK